MATLIPALGTSSFDSTGERRLAERLEQKLDGDYLLWHNVPIGPKQTHPDFVVLHPRHGLLIAASLPTVDDRDADAIQIMTMKVSKGLEFPVAATRATQRLVIGVGGDGGFGKRLGT